MQRLWKHLERRCHDDAERSQRAVMKLHQVVASDVLDHAPASGREPAVGEGDADADEEIASRAEALAKRAGPSRREEAADGVAGRVERVEREKLPALAELRLQRLEGDPRLDAHDHARLRVFEPAVEL